MVMPRMCMGIICIMIVGVRMFVVIVGVRMTTTYKWIMLINFIADNDTVTIMKSGKNKNGCNQQESKYLTVYTM